MDCSALCLRARERGMRAQVLADFLQGVLHASRLFGDELLAACLDLLLAAPPSLVPVQARPGPRRAALLRVGAAHVSASARRGEHAGGVLTWSSCVQAPAPRQCHHVAQPQQHSCALLHWRRLEADDVMGLSSMQPVRPLALAAHSKRLAFARGRRRWRRRCARRSRWACSTRCWRRRRWRSWSAGSAARRTRWSPSSCRRARPPRARSRREPLCNQASGRAACAGGKACSELPNKHLGCLTCVCI